MQAPSPPSPTRWTTLDLFAGAGGMALGFEAAGARCVGAVEHDPVAGATFERAFGPLGAVVLAGPDAGEMSSLEPKWILDQIGARPDIIIGGPPCQGFSRIGRAKQMSLLEPSDRIRLGGRDPDRNQLYRKFLAVVQEAEPLAFVIENVPGLRHMQGVDIAGRIARESAHLGYNVRYFLLNSAWYGVPQQRWRLFFVGLRCELGHNAIPAAPPRTHDFGADYPEGTAPADDKLMIHGENIPRPSHSTAATTVFEALADLPRLVEHRHGAKQKDIPMPLRATPTPWVAQLRDWPGRPAPSLVTGNWHRATPRDYDLFFKMAQGASYPNAHAIAVEAFHTRLRQLRQDGRAPRPQTAEYDDLRRSIVPPYRNDAFDEKWVKLDPCLPAPTLTAHLSRDSYSHIHYDSSQARTITIREAARLQSFPDAYEFCGNYGDQFRQIGNAVPPLMAKAVAAEVFVSLERALTQGHRA